jgi:hypothetical protein
MLALLQDSTTPPIPSLTYGSSVTNAYIQIAQIIKRATASPIPPAPFPLILNQRVPMDTPPVQEQRVLAQPPSSLASPHSPITPEVRPTPTKTPLSTRPPIPRRQSRRTIRPPSQSPHGPLAQTATVNPYARYIAALTTTPPTSGKQGSIKKLLHGPDSKVWERGLANEWGRLLSHGIGTTRPPSDQIKGTGNIFFITKSQVPADRKVTHANFVYSIRLQKSETHRVRMTAGGDKLDYPGDASSPTVSMLDAKLHLNSTISDAKHGARHLGLDIKNYFLGTPMAYYQYMRVQQSVIPQEV